MSDGRDDEWGGGGSSLPPPPPPPTGRPPSWAQTETGSAGGSAAPQQGQPAWGRAGEQGYGPAPAPRNGLALASMICGLASVGCLLLFFLLVTVPLAVALGVAAIATGILGLRAVGRDGAGGRGQAITGIVTGTLSLLAVVALTVLALTAWSALDFRTNPFADPEGFIEELEDRGFEVDEDGQVDLEELERRLEEAEG